MTAIADRLRRRLASSGSPTADLYFANAFAGTDPPGAGAWLAPTVYATGRDLVVFRHDTGAPVRADDRRRLVYVLDDAIFAGGAGLPGWYRAKLALFERAAARRLLPRAGVVVVSSESLARSLPPGLVRPGAERIVLDPHWLGRMPGLDHFAPGDGLGIGYFGSQSHGANATFVLEVIKGVLARLPEARFSLPDSHRLPEELRRHPGVEILPSGPWPSYRRGAARRRVHLALYPLAETGFDRARSVNKLIEHGLAGAATIGAPGWARRHGLVPGRDLVCAPRQVAAWRGAILDLAARPDRLRALARRGQTLAEAVNDPRPQRGFWRALLG